MNEICVIGKFRHLENENTIYVATTRLASGKVCEVDRFIQARQLSNDLRQLDNLILTGDFGDEPDSNTLMQMDYNWYSRAYEIANGSEPHFTSFQFDPINGHEM